MNDIAEPIDAEVVDETAAFFAPVSFDAIDTLLSKYQARRTLIDELAELVEGGLGHVVGYFIEGNAGDDRTHSTLYVDKLFKREGAIAALNAHFWKQALDLTDVYNLMPQKRRDEWNEQIRNPLGKRAANLSRFDGRDGMEQKEWDIQPLPDFEEETVRSTLADLLYSRARFFAERVDGIFRSLSHEHVTNCPQGFSKRMIIAGMFNFYSGGHSSSNWSRMGVINDLRCVIAKFMGREEPGHGATNSIIEDGRARIPGEWVILDGGAIRIRVYLKGTAHLEIHPEMAWRLNSVLASIHPAAIPAKFRTAPKRKSKEWTLLQQILPFPVLGLLDRMKPAKQRYEHRLESYFRDIPMSLSFDYGINADDAIMKEAERVLEAIGGVKHCESGRISYWKFDYPPESVIREIVASGCIPNHKAHQFYPTPPWLAQRAVDTADIQPGDLCLEPSAGQGAIAEYLPAEKTDCIEISPLHCAILKSKGHRTIEADFLQWHAPQKYDRIVMNPPFSDGRAQTHISHAAEMVRPGGKLVAIIPAGMRAKPLIDGWRESWSEPINNAFKGASVSVSIYEAIRPSA